MVVVVMGVAGAGKSTVGRLLASELGWRFIDADDYHSEQNRQKMARGQALTDDDRQQWLDMLRNLIGDIVRRGESAVLACSALREAYRRQLTPDPLLTRFVYLRASRELIHERMRHRSRHFAGCSLVESQFRTLEEPSDALTLDAALPTAELVAEIKALLFPFPSERG